VSPAYEIVARSRESRNDPSILERRAGEKRRPPGNRAAFSLGRIVPTEAKPSELSGEILDLAKYPVKAKTAAVQLLPGLGFTHEHPLSNELVIFVILSL